tara:strand:- start:443 stop:730 length:288 start_codon:yes stop_codon:yes gene_type:complete
MSLADQKYPPAPRGATHAVFTETDSEWNPTGKGATILANSIETLTGVTGIFYYAKYPARGKKVLEKVSEEYKWNINHVPDYQYVPKKRGRPPKKK